MRSFRIFLILVFSFYISEAQNLSFKQLKVEDGLSHNSVISMLQDDNGFLWFGTKDGLNRYDGYNFKIFRNESENENSLGSNFIRCLYQFDGHIWVGTDTGLFKYNDKTESFKLILSTKDKPILDIEGDSKGNLWFIASGTLHKLDLTTDKTKEESFDQFYTSFITTNEEGDVYVSSSDLFYQYVPENNSFKRIELEGTAIENGVSDLIITTINAHSKDSIFIGTKNKGALLYNRIKNTLTPLLKEDENPLFVRDFLMKNNKELWIASESGIFIYNLEKGTYQNSTKSYNNPYSLSDNAIYSLVLDREGGVWIGTYFGGVNYYPKQYTPIDRYFPKVGENSISGNAIREIKKDSFGNIWVGTEDAGLNKLETDTGRFKNYFSVRSGGILSHYNIHGLLPRNDELWIGTFEHGLDIMDIKTGKVKHHFGTASYEGGLRSDFILYIYETRNKDVYVLTSSGIHRYKPESNSFELVEGFPEIYHYTTFIEDHRGVLWAGTYWDGLFYYDPKTKDKGFYRFNSNDKSSLSSNVINGLFEDSSNNLWVTTENGLNLFNQKEDNFYRYTTENGFPSNVAYSILEDDDSNLWISTSNGLVEFSMKEQELKVFTKSNGLLSDQFNYNSAFKDENGKMYFGSVNGLISFNPDKFIQNNYQPPIYITNIQINNQDVSVKKNNSPLETSITFSENIELNNQQSTFSLEFASLSYTAPEMTKYWYKLEGLNENWIPIGKNHKVSFNELPAGDYTFKVKAFNSHGVWSNENSSLKIEVLPPFLSSNLAYVFYAALLILIIFFLLRYYHRYNRDKNNLRIQQLENDKEKEIYQAKIEFFTNIAHEIRTPLTLIKSPLEKLLSLKYNSLEIPKNLGIMERNTSRLLNLVNELLDFRKTEMKHVKLSFVEVNISQLLEETYIRFSQLIKDKNIHFDITKKEKDIYAFVDEEATRKILSNLFSNAIKYCEYHVQVQLEKTEDHFRIIVQNDGEKIPLELKQRIFEPFFRVPGETKKSGTGIGLSLAHSLAELHHGKLFINSNNLSLNEFVLQIPLHQDNEFRAFKNQPKEVKESDEIIRKFDNDSALILVAEDNPELADFILNELSEKYNIIVASNGKEAWKAICTYEVDIVISDVMMPFKSGIELCKEIKEDIDKSHIPVILLTAKSALNAKIEGLESGADAYISKPFSLNHLQVQISNLLQNRKSIIGHYNSSPLAHLKSLSLATSDKSFISKLDQKIDDNLKDTNLNVEMLARHMNMSRSTLYRKIKDISNLSPNELINESRLKKAAYLLKTSNLKIYEISEKVGFKSQSSFGRSFQKHFSMTPSEFIDQDHNI
ncbi:histidine kinase [Salegentibacter salinarum]|uniref:histidine kinase n=1 Tax=Salegentibacter salinarum TaxID=447422 RepID=A0A2N0TWG0_9FLAO|nr:hybrid sensor histidine kinase/response regulator transcription factor [Salegentibacter salinarum]PKD19083.1 histidine kinase [Salegentibacter salinarum]SKB95699.1 Two component regulator propeller [Salegentibacter salinarum]